MNKPLLFFVIVVALITVASVVYVKNVGDKPKAAKPHPDIYKAVPNSQGSGTEVSPKLDWQK